MNNAPIARSRVIMFLGILFDEKLNFKEHIESVREKATSRLNLIKTLSNKSWGLERKTLVKIYNAVTRSLFDYSSSILSSLSDPVLDMLQIIQNVALRTITHSHFNKLSKNNIRISELHEMTNMPLVMTKLNELNVKHFTNALAHKNPLVHSFLDEDMLIKKTVFILQ